MHKLINNNEFSITQSQLCINKQTKLQFFKSIVWDFHGIWSEGSDILYYIVNFTIL